MSLFNQAKKRALLIVIMGALIVGSAHSSVPFTVTIQNQSVHFGATIDTLFFDLYIVRTGATSIYLANCDFRVNFNNTNFTSPALAVIANTGDLTGYGVSTGLVLTNTAMSLSLSPPVPNDNTDFGPVIPEVSNVGIGSRIATIRVRGVTNRAGTAGLGFRVATPQFPTGVTMFDVTDPAAATTITITGDGTYTNPVDLPLPVELVSFTALAQGRTVNLAWTTKTETSNYGFDIERKAVSTAQSTSDSWTKVGFIAGKGTSTSSHDYSFRDVVKSAGTFTYRLKQTDRDGKFNYSAQVEAKATLTADDYKLSQNYPNPFNPSTKFSFAVKTTQHVAVTVFNTLGQEVATLFNDVVPADQIQEVTFDGARLSSGIYYYVLRAQDRVEVKKMLMVK